MILDTNALSAAADGQPAAIGLIARADRIAIPVVVLGEYQFGIAQSKQREAYENWLDEWTAVVEVLDIDQDTARHYAAIGLNLKRIGKPIPTNDLWIAALCRQHTLSLLSQDRHFDAVTGIQRIGW